MELQKATCSGASPIHRLASCYFSLSDCDLCSLAGCFQLCLVSCSKLQRGWEGRQHLLAHRPGDSAFDLVTYSPWQSCGTSTFSPARPSPLHLVFAYCMTPSRTETFSTGVAATYMVACVIKCRCQSSVKLSERCSPAKGAACKGVYAVLLSLNSVQVCQTCLHCMQMITKGFILFKKQSIG